MARNRIIYNVQGLFVGPYSGEQNPNLDYYLTGYQILKRIEKVQNFNYGIDNNRINIEGFGTKKNIFRGLASQPTVNFTFSYTPDGFTNENRLNFDVANFQSSIQAPMFSGLCQDNSITDKKDFYLVINNNNNDLFINYPITNEYANPTSVSDIIDPNSPNYSLLYFQNSYLTKYSFSVNVGEVPSVEQTYIADNINFYLSGSGINYTTLNVQSGNQNIENTKLIIPRNINPSELSGQNILLPGDASVSFSTLNTTGVLFYTDTLETLNFNLSFDRQNLRSLNYKFPQGRNINFPVNCDLNMSFIVKENLSGSFFDTLNRDQDYNIVVNFSNCITGVYPSRFIFSGARFNDINYNSSIGTNKTANLSFNFDIDPDFGNRGIFASGNVLYYGHPSQLSGTQLGVEYLLIGTENAINYELSYTDSIRITYY
jgi:hypothetical protein